MEGSVATRPSDLIVREAADLRVLESTDPGGDGIFNADGTVNIVIQRPGAGRGPGNRIFEAAHLQADCEAGTFVGWPMYDNHDSPLARKARGSLPRPPSELAGVVRETWWDPDFEDPELDARLNYGKGAACGRAAVSEDMERLIRRLPEAIKTSVNAMAKNLSRGTWRGKNGWVVEGYVNDPEDSSIDFVTKAGAGGAIRDVLEAVADDVRSRGGGLYAPGHEPHGDEEAEVNLKEALESPEFGRVLEAKLDEVIETKGLISEEEADKRVQEAVAKQVGVRDLLTIARDRITSAKGIGDAAKEDLLLRFGVRDLGNGVLEAAAELDVKPELEGDTVKKTSAQVLEAKLEGAIKRERDKVQGSPGAQTRVGGQGPQGGGASDNGGDGDDGRVQEAKTEADVPDWVMAAHRAGVDVSEAYGWKLPESMTKAKA